MADYITKIRVKENGTIVKKQIDYNALANLPTISQTTGDSETAIMSQKAVTDALRNAGGGSDSNLLLYPDVIIADGHDALSNGEQVILPMAIDTGIYVILQPYKNTYKKRVLGRCVSSNKEQKELTITAVQTTTNGSLLAIGENAVIYADNGWANVGDNVAIGCRQPDGTLIGWVLAEVIAFSVPHYSIVVTGLLPSDYDGSIGKINIDTSTSTIEVLAVIDGYGQQMYKHITEIVTNNTLIGFGVTINTSTEKITSIGDIDTFKGNNNNFIISAPLGYNGTNYYYQLRYFTVGSTIVITVAESELELRDAVTLL